MSPAVDFNKSIWIRSDLQDQQYIFRSIRNALLERGVQVLSLKGPRDAEGLERIRKIVWGSDAHVVLDGIPPNELRKLKPVFRERKNFSVGLVDWWTSDYWFTKNARHLIFRNYNGIAIRRGLGKFSPSRRPPLWVFPRNANWYDLACTGLRLPALIAAPLLEMWKRWQRHLEKIEPDQLLYFPFTLLKEHVPLEKEPIKFEFDFSNVSGTSGFWLMRDPHASAWLNFGNMYYDRLRTTDRIFNLSSSGYKLFDLRRNIGRLDWDNYCRVVRRSRFAIATGGLHQTSVAKYTEFACLGTPMLGEEIPFEFPWLGKCLMPLDTMSATQSELHSKLRMALDQHSTLRNHCLNLREELLRMYHPYRILDMLQDQANGKPIPAGYLKPAASSPTS